MLNTPQVRRTQQPIEVSNYFSLLSLHLLFLHIFLSRSVAHRGSSPSFSRHKLHTPVFPAPAVWRDRWDQSVCVSRSVCRHVSGSVPVRLQLVPATRRRSHRHPGRSHSGIRVPAQGAEHQPPAAEPSLHHQHF